MQRWQGKLTSPRLFAYDPLRLLPCRWALWSLVAITVVAWSAFVLVASADLDIALPGPSLDPTLQERKIYADGEQSYVKPTSNCHHNMLDASGSPSRHRAGGMYGL